VCVGEAALTINVVDVNDERPLFELPVYIFDVEENQSPGIEVGVVSAADRELAPFDQFTLTWRSPVDHFMIDPQTGVITTTQSLDHELQVYHWHACISRLLARVRITQLNKICTYAHL